MTQYMLEGYGENTKTALNDLEKKESGLIDKLKKASESTDLKFSTTYHVHYAGKSKFLAELICPDFKIKVNSQDKIEEEAKKRANGGKLSSYETKFTVQRTYNLNAEQFNVVTMRHTSSPPAGIDADEESSLVSILKR